MFAATENEKDFVLHKVSAPAILLFKNFDEGVSTYAGDFSAASITSFIASNSIALLADIGPDNYEVYVKRALPIAYVFAASPEQKDTLRPIFLQEAKKYNGKISFVFIDAVAYGGHAGNLGLAEGKVIGCFRAFKTFLDVNY